MALGVAVSLRHIVEIHQNRRMEARAFSHERKCAGIKDANTEHIQAEYIFFAFLPVFLPKSVIRKNKEPARDTY